MPHGFTSPSATVTTSKATLVFRSGARSVPRTPASAPARSAAAGRLRPAAPRAKPPQISQSFSCADLIPAAWRSGCVTRRREATDYTDEHGYAGQRIRPSSEEQQRRRRQLNKTAVYRGSWCRASRGGRSRDRRDTNRTETAAACISPSLLLRARRPAAPRTASRPSTSVISVISVDQRRELCVRSSSPPQRRSGIGKWPR